MDKLFPKFRVPVSFKMRRPIDDRRSRCTKETVCLLGFYSTELSSRSASLELLFWRQRRGPIFQGKGTRMLEGRGVIGESDMPQKMQIHAMRCASQALDLHDVTECKDIAGYIKKEFDKAYGPSWQCVVGTSFGSYVTHSCGSFIYFGLERLAFLLFRGVTSST